MPRPCYARTVCFFNSGAIYAGTPNSYFRLVSSFFHIEICEAEQCKRRASMAYLIFAVVGLSKQASPKQRAPYDNSLSKSKARKKDVKGSFVVFFRAMPESCIMLTSYRINNNMSTKSTNGFRYFRLFPKYEPKIKIIFFSKFISGKFPRKMDKSKLSRRPQAA